MSNKGYAHFVYVHVAHTCTRSCQSPLLLILPGVFSSCCFQRRQCQRAMPVPPSRGGGDSDNASASGDGSQPKSRGFRQMVATAAGMLPFQNLMGLSAKSPPPERQVGSPQIFDIGSPLIGSPIGSPVGTPKAKLPAPKTPPKRPTLPTTTHMSQLPTHLGGTLQSPPAAKSMPVPTAAPPKAGTPEAGPVVMAVPMPMQPSAPPPAHFSASSE